MFEYKFSKLAMQNIDPDGDLEIVLTNTTPTTSVLVSSKCLTLASKVFAAMLSPKFREGAALAKDGKTKIELEDDAKTAIIVLRALHHCNRLVPSYLDADELHVMALIVDKYDLLQAMLPWIKHWVVHHYFAALDSANYHKWLLISWVFEEGTLFTSITKKLIMETKLDKEDELVTKEEKHFCEGVSDLIIAALKKKRQDLMTRLTKVVMEESKRYEAFVAVNSTSFACKVASNSTEARKLCDIYSLGNLTRCLIRARMFDRFLDANAMTLDVLSGLKSIESSADAIHIYQRQRDIRNSASHTSCGSRDGILRIVKEVEDSCTGLRLVDFVRVKSEM